ncbi:MAG: polysaccharide biosynthesis protein [Lachnospira sp.]|nr:polysaccharide biosynthesis protein [Lachnospira sp.]
MEQTKKDNMQLLVRRVFLLITDILLINGAVFLSLIMRFDIAISQIPTEYMDAFLINVIPHTVITLMIFWMFGMYQSLWQYASITEVYKIVQASVVAEVVHISFTFFVDWRLPRSCYFMTAVFMIMALGASRFMYRMVRGAMNSRVHTKDKYNLMIVGAGNTTDVILREIQDARYMENAKVTCIIDDDPSKIGKSIRGVKVAGDRNCIKAMVRKYDVDEIIIAIPSASNVEKSKIISICKDTDCSLKIVPAVHQMMNGEFNVNEIRNVDVEDLLGREPVQVNLDTIMGYVKGKTIMVTGGGGSIGSELCRQLVAYEPERLIIFDIYENSAYEIEQELRIKKPQTEVIALIGSVRNMSRLEDVFAQYKPDIVYHAAAHKHVPLMETSPNEAVKNNVCGTWNVARMADKYSCEKMVLISTDKAVNPVNMMGATKRICEMIIQTYNEKSKTEFVAVRFGNVLGSNGSVIPLFKKQIQAGGPITVTHPDVIRYFMTIPEAVSLVLEAGAYAKGGEIFILDMGQPVKIDDLAKNLIRLSGLTLGVDMEIEYTGLRPGEKLYEELLMEEEGLQDTDNKLIHIGKPMEFDKEEFLIKLENLEKVAYEENGDIRDYVKQIVTTYKPE